MRICYLGKGVDENETPNFPLDNLTRHGVILGSTGSGKCLGPDELVMMFSGHLVKSKHIESGDLLMGPDSKPRKVLSTTKGIGPMFKIIPIKGKPWVCNDVHVLTLVNSKTGVITDIPLNEYEEKNKGFKHLHKQFFVGVDFPKRKSSPIDPYFLGVWFGDGKKSLKGINIYKPDVEIMNCVKETAKQWNLSYITDGGIEHSIVNKQRRRFKHINPLLSAMRKLLGDKVKIPKCIKYGSKETRLQFLAGFIDTDGHLSNGVYDFVQKRKDYASDVMFIARSLGIQATVVEKVINDEIYYRVCLSGNLSVLPIRIERKKAQPRQQIKDVTRTGFTVESIGIGRYAGFTLDGDGRFLLGDFTVTHNTGVGITLIESCLINQIPVIAIDPKGDLGNLVYMPECIKTAEGEALDSSSYANFENYFNQSIPTKQPMPLSVREKNERTPSVITERMTREFRDWKIPPCVGSNILKSTDIRLYTPGCSYGMPLGVFGGSQKPASDKPDRLNEASALAQSLLSILGLKSGPNGDTKVLLEQAIWRIWEGEEEPTPKALAEQLERVDDELLKTEVKTLIKRLTSLAGSFSFHKWKQKPTLDIKKLLKNGAGVPCCSILNTVHLLPEENQFFIGVLLSKLLTWVKQQPSSNYLRAVLYIDECQGLIPAMGNPVTKQLLMTLIKQARAFGLGIVLATQNPGDIDYKALSNVGTWVTGLLKTDLDRKKVCQAMQLTDKKVLGELTKREFIYHDTFSGSEKKEVRFKSRQTICYLKGPMDQVEIERVTAWRKLSTYEKEIFDKSSEAIDVLTSCYEVNHFNPSQDFHTKKVSVMNLAWQFFDMKEEGVTC